MTNKKVLLLKKNQHFSIRDFKKQYLIFWIVTCVSARDYTVTWIWSVCTLQCQRSSAAIWKFVRHQKMSGQNNAVPAIVCWVDKVLSSQNILAISCKGHWYVLQAFQVDNLEKSGEKNCKSSLHFFISHISYLICLYHNRV